MDERNVVEAHSTDENSELDSLSFETHSGMAICFLNPNIL